MLIEIHRVIELERAIEVILQIKIMLGEETIFTWSQNKLVTELE